MNVELVKKFKVEAAHNNELGLHGHTYTIGVVVAGCVDETHGWLVDYGEIKALFQPLHDQLDHGYLNEVPGLEDTSVEGLSRWIQECLAPVLPCLKDVRVGIVGDCAYRPVELPSDGDASLPARLRFTFEAAQSLPHLPEVHPCHDLHGHTYRVEVGANDPAGLREPLQRVYQGLDHRYLNEIPGLEKATSEALCRWIWNEISADAEGLQVVVVQESETSRCVYHGR